MFPRDAGRLMYNKQKQLVTQAYNIQWNSNIIATITDDLNWIIDYFLMGPSRESDKKPNTKITDQMCNEFENVLSGIGCFEGIITVQIKEGSNMCQPPPRQIIYTLQQPFK